jgi:hypothetical protein
MASSTSPTLYETTWTLKGREPEIGFTFFSLPTAKCNREGREFLAEPGRLSDKFGLGKATEQVLISELPWTVFELLLAAESSKHDAVAPTRDWLGNHNTPSNLQLYALAEYLTFAELVTFELSDPKEYSLGSLAVQSARRIIRKGGNVLGWIGIGKEASAMGGAKAAALGAALAPVAFKVALAGTGIVLVADTIGAVAGLPESSRTKRAYKEASEAVRRTFERFTKRK